MTELNISNVVRARLDLSYDGTDFAGWATQPDLRTVQGDIEAALARILRDDRGNSLTVQTTVAGRTDAGVHARGQVAHVDIPTAAWQRLSGRSGRAPAAGLKRSLNGLLADDIVVLDVQHAPAGFDARFSALQRRYAYRLCDDHQLRNPLTRRHVVWHEQRLDVDQLNSAAQTLTGLRDFAAFCKARPGATTIRELVEFSWERVTEGPDEGLVVATVRADAFCHSMVRSLVGALLPLGSGRRDQRWLTDVAKAQARSSAVAVAPAHGLTLESVEYPADADLAARVLLTKARRDQEG